MTVNRKFRLMTSLYKNKKRRLISIFIIITLPSIVYLYAKHDINNDDAIILSDAIPNRPSNPILVGPLFENVEFIKYLENCSLQEVNSNKLDVVNLTSLPIIRENELTLSDNGIISASKRKGNICFVEQATHWRNLKVTTEPNAIYTTYSSNSDLWDLWDRHIHSLSISNSGEFLVFMISSDCEWVNWKNQNLMIYDFNHKTIKRIWRGNISGPKWLLNPYQWVQPLCWPRDDKEVLLSNSKGNIIAINIFNGKQRKLCKGFLPIGYVNENVLLVLRKKGFFTRNYWSIIEYDQNTKQETQLALFKGPEEMRAPLISPNKKYISFVARIYPNENPRIGIFHYTVFFDLKSHEWGIAKAEITAWSE